MKKQEAARELIQSIDRVFEIEEEYGFGRLFKEDWVAIGKEMGIPYIEESYDDTRFESFRYIHHSQEAQVLNARISALAVFAGLRDRGWDAEIGFDSYHPLWIKHAKEYYSGWGKSDIPPFAWPVLRKLRTLREEAIMCQGKEAGAEETPPTKIEADDTKPAGTGPETKPAKKLENEKPMKQGRKSKYTPEKIKNMLTSYEKHFQEKNYVKYAWNCVAEEHGIESGKAAEMAVRRYQKKNK